MAERDQRLQRIGQLIRRRAISTQSELRAWLRKEGLAVNQATLSRDLSELGIRKAGGRYVIDAPRSAGASDGAGLDLSASVLSFTTCGPNLVVVRTHIGQAQAVAVAIDNAGDSSITGTVAGDDTIFVAMRDQRAQSVALRRLKTWFGVMK